MNIFHLFSDYSKGEKFTQIDVPIILLFLDKDEGKGVQEGRNVTKSRKYCEKGRGKIGLLMITKMRGQITKKYTYSQRRTEENEKYGHPPPCCSPSKLI